VARLAVINHATGMIRLNCCSHVFALEAAVVRLVAWSEKRRAGGEERRVRREEGNHDLPPPPSKTGGKRREAMSVTSGNYARVPVAIGLLILLGARWERALLAPRLAEPVASAATWRSF